jgi:hypothetical protein
MQQPAFAPQRSVHPLYRKILIPFAIIVVLLAIGALWLSSVRSRITVTVKRDTTSIDTALDVAKNPDSGQLRGRVVQGTFEKVQQFNVQGAGTTVSTGVVAGTVKIINNYSKPQTLVEKTRLLTSDNRLYRIDKTVTVAAKSSVTVAAHADQEGANFALAAGEHLTIPGLWIDLQKFIYAEPVAAFSGNQTVVKTVGDRDITDAFKTLKDVLTQQATKALDTEAATGDGWKAIYDVKVVDKKNTIDAGQKADSFVASMKILVTAVYYPTSDINAFLRDKLKDKLPDGRDLVDFDASQATFTVDSSDPKNETARLHITANAGSRLTDKSPAMAKTNFLGMSDVDAKSKIQAIEGVDSVDVRISPSWIHTIPKSADHVELIVQ